MPCYNYGQYITETIDSVQASTINELEIIIVDDGSTDPLTKNVLNELSRRPSVRVIRRPNGGLAAARNTGIAATTAAYILPLDADDLIDPSYIEKAVWIFENCDRVDFVYPLVKLFGAENRIWRTLPYNFQYLKFRNYIPAAMIMRRTVWETVGGYSEEMRGGYEDWEFLLKAGKVGFKGLHLNEVLFYYRKHAGSMLQDSKKRHRELFGDIRKRNKEIYTFFHVRLFLFCLTELKRRLVEATRLLMSQVWIRTPHPLKERLKAIRVKTLPRGPIVPPKSLAFGTINDNHETTNVIGKPTVMLVLPWLEVGGVERVFLQIVTHLSDHFEFVIVTTKAGSMHPWTAKFQRHSRATYHIGDFTRNDQCRTLFMLHLIERYNVKVVHVSNSEFGYSCLPAIKQMDESIHTVDTLHMQEPWAAWDYFRLSRAFVDYLDSRVTLTQSQSGLLSQNHHGKDVHVIANGVSTESFSDRTRQFMDDKKFTVAFVARFDIQKRPSLFVDCVKIAVERKWPMRFLMVGDGKLKGAVMRRVRKLGIADRIEFRPFCDDVFKVLEDVDVLSIPSLREGLPMIGLEAMSLGIPIVATNVPGWEDIVQNGRQGFLCSDDAEEIAKKWYELYADPEMYCRFSKEAHQRASTDFLVTDMTKKYMRLYNELLCIDEGRQKNGQ